MSITLTKTSKTTRNNRKNLYSSTFLSERWCWII